MWGGEAATIVPYYRHASCMSNLSRVQNCLLARIPALTRQVVLSKTKRQSHFPWMTDEEIKQSEIVVVDAFSPKR